MRPQTVYRTLFCLLGLSCQLCVSAQITINGPLPANYTEDFNTLPTSVSDDAAAWSDNSTLPGWFAENETGDPLNIRYGDTRSTGGSSGRGLYSFGDRNVPDMALGVITTNTSGDITYGVKFQNQTGQTIQSITVSYTGEQWRISNGQRPQVLGFSYLVSNVDPTIALPERTSGYVYVPELFLTSPRFDTTGLNLAGETGLPLDGNLTANRVTISFSFNVTVADGQYLLLRWYKENTTKIEFGLGIDDLSVDFSAAAQPTLSFMSNAPIYHYIAGPIDLRIPDEDDSESYDPPTTVESGVPTPEETTFRSLIQNMLSGNYAQVRTDAPTIGYQLVTFTDAANGNRQHQVLRHDGVVDNPHHWGTYIFSVAPVDANTYLSIPHPVFDRFTTRQGGYLYTSMDLAGIQIAGNYRCSSNAMGCFGSSSVCGGSNVFRASDASHAVEMPFHYASGEIADADADNYFVQLHGFGHVGGDPDLIVSNGTDQTPSGSDRVVDFVDYIDNNSSFDAAGVHSDPYTAKLTGYTNTFGRYLNVHQDDICDSDEIADASTDRFIHIEQRSELREIEANYSLIQNALTVALATPLPLVLISFDYQLIDGVPELRWEASSTRNVDYIEVMGSFDGLDFYPLGRRTALNVETKVKYSFELPASPLQYFRLRIVDYDASVEESEILQIPEAVESVRAYPSLIEDHVEIWAPAGADFHILDAMGRKVLQGCLDGPTLKIDTQHWRKGMYFLKMVTGSTTRSHKLIKK